MSRISSNGEETVYQLTRIGSAATVSGVADIFKLNQDVTLIGRAKEKVQFFIDSSKHIGLISRFHARIFKSKTNTGQDVFKICDTSLNGTFVNDIKILNEASLKPGDSVAFGHLQGAALQVGNSYSQPNSEFCFKFEISSEAKHSGCKLRLNDMEYVKNYDPGLATDMPPQEHKTPTALDFPNLSIPLETPTPFIASGNYADRGPMSQSTCTTKRKLVKTFDASDDESETDFKTFQEYASAASVAAAMQSDSDEDLFSIKYTSVLPGGVSSEISEKEERYKDQERKMQKRRVKRENTSKSSKNTSSDSLDTCSAMKCLKPNEKLVSWVQCDDCDQWYHVKCAGISFKLVKLKNAKFHCGCV